MQHLGSGGNGSVWLVDLAPTIHGSGPRERVALKRIKCHNLFMANMALEEVKSLMKIEHGNIVRYRDFFLEEDGTTLSVCFAMEYCSRGDLWSYVEQYGVPKSDTACTWTWQIASALEYLHNNHTIHRDLKPNNVLLDEKWVCKVADFGLARVHFESSPIHSQVGTVIFRAPEILHQREYTEKVDLWALGCTMYSVLTHTLRSLNIEVYSNPNLLGELTHELRQNGYPDSLTEIIIALIDVQPERRPSAQQVKRRIEATAHSPPVAHPPSPPPEELSHPPELDVTDMV
eukprot:EG_transcript_12780